MPRSMITGQFVPLDPREYLYSQFRVSGLMGCWEWGGPTFHGGYGAFKCQAIKKGQMNASRASWIIHNGPIASARIQVCHTCDNRKCVNPSHLFLGSCKINMEDCKSKGRTNKGEERPQHKLTEEEVRQLRRLRQSGASWRGLAAQFGVCVTSVVSAVKGITWAHVDEPIPTYIGSPGRPRAS